MVKLATSLSRIVTFRYGVLGAPGRLKYALDVPKTPPQKDNCLPYNNYWQITESGVLCLQGGFPAGLP
jgi:hypothetical protein